MARKRNWRTRGCGILAAGCLALLFSGCSLPAPHPGEPAPTTTTGGDGASAAPLALLPATMPGDPPDTSPPTPSGGGGSAAVPVTAYFVLVDDGGRNGIRFGCNDSLVGFARPAAAGNARLGAAIGALLGSGQQPGNSYNALSTSRLTFLSGNFDGTTATVYLSGTLNRGGSCDPPRIEAQLTQTALEAVGAIRAEVYINGEILAEYLAQK
ncbi:hypothetical protein [Pseudarthrobacter sp. NPDC058119]|uniref:hypothetical protein n=1 Tax=Pseudarthrobacter sp. NPDC058119 TaxID=3346348 RepID=UPI0036D80869